MSYDADGNWVPEHYEGTYANTYEEMYDIVYNHILFCSYLAAEYPGEYSGLCRMGFSPGTPDRTELVGWDPYYDSEYTTHDVATRIVAAFPEVFGYHDGEQIFC